jgi:hypothetical protein
MLAVLGSKDATSIKGDNFPSDGVFGHFDLAALLGCHTKNICLFNIGPCKMGDPFATVASTISTHNCYTYPVHTHSLHMILKRVPCSYSLLSPIDRLLQAALADLEAATGDSTPPGEYFNPLEDSTEPSSDDESPSEAGSPPTVTILPPGTAGFSETGNPSGNSMLNSEFQNQARSSAIQQKQAAHNELGPKPQQVNPVGESVNVGAVVGGVLGALAVVGLAIGAVVWSKKRERGHRYSRYQNDEI